VAFFVFCHENGTFWGGVPPKVPFGGGSGVILTPPWLLSSNKHVKRLHLRHMDMSSDVCHLRNAMDSGG